MYYACMVQPAGYNLNAPHVHHTMHVLTTKCTLNIAMYVYFHVFLVLTPLIRKKRLS